METIVSKLLTRAKTSNRQARNDQAAQRACITAKAKAQMNYSPYTIWRDLMKGYNGVCIVPRCGNMRLSNQIFRPQTATSPHSIGTTSHTSLTDYCLEMTIKDSLQSLLKHLFVQPRGRIPVIGLQHMPHSRWNYYCCAGGHCLSQNGLAALKCFLQCP